MEYGVLRCNLDVLLKKKNISRTRICKDLDISSQNLNRYYKNQFQRIDGNFIIKVCYYLDTTIDQLFEYIPPSKV